jgi:hypothetical protein
VKLEKTRKFIAFNTQIHIILSRASNVRTGTEAIRANIKKAHDNKRQCIIVWCMYVCTYNGDISYLSGISEECLIFWRMRVCCMYAIFWRMRVCCMYACMYLYLYTLLCRENTHSWPAES